MEANVLEKVSGQFQRRGESMRCLEMVSLESN